MPLCAYVGHLLGKGGPLGCRLWCLTVSLSLSHWYPGSGVVLDCIDSWSLHPYLLRPPFLLTVPRRYFFYESFILFAFVFVILPCLFFAALWSPLKKELTSWFSCLWMFSCVLSLSKYGVLGQVWYLIVWIPDLCLLSDLVFLLFQCG